MVQNISETNEIYSLQILSPLDEVSLDLESFLRKFCKTLGFDSLGSAELIASVGASILLERISSFSIEAGT